MDTSIDSITEEVLAKLSKWKPYIHHEAATGSIYIKFPHWGLGSIRIGDHDGRNCYTYRWQIRTDKPADYQEKGVHKQVRFFEYGSDKVDVLVAEFERQAENRWICPGEKATWGDYNGH